MKQIVNLGLLHAVALVAVLAGAAGSVGLTLHAGRNNTSALLVALFLIWVLSPFIGLFVANVVARNSSVTSRVALYSLMLFISIGSLVGYSGVFSPHSIKAAAVFLIVPLLSWFLMLVVILAARSISRRSEDV
jgi:hypothetical protein